MRLLARLVAAAVLAAAAGLALPTSPAVAASCSSSHGVTVVVDPHGLGGGVQTRCVGGGGGDSARALFGAAGFSLTDVQRTPGFVCRVEGKPASDPCVNTPPSDAYWGLWWSDGKSGSWSYGTRGVDSLSVPDGGYVALSWNGSSARSAPGVSPAPHPATSTKPSSKPNTKPNTKPSSTSKPTAKATPKPTRKPSAATSTTQAATPSASSSMSPSASVSAAPSASGSTSPSASVPGSSASTSTLSATAANPAESAAPTSTDASDQPADSGRGLPAWVGLAVVALLLTAGAAVAVVRRRGRPAP